jgi:hypothetical protein
VNRISGALDIPIPYAARPGPARPKGERRGTKGGKRTPAALERMGADVLAYVKANPGKRADQLAAALKTDVGTIRLPMQKLSVERRVRTEGQRRGMRYFAGVGSGMAKRPKRRGKR